MAFQSSGATNGGMLCDKIETVACLVDAEQRAAQCDLANQAPALRRIIELCPSAVQPVVEGAGGVQVAHCKGDMVNPQDVRHGRLR